MDRSDGKPVVAVSAIFQHSPAVFLAMKDSGISRPADLAGKRVMLMPGYHNLIFLAFLQKEGLLKKIERQVSSTDVQDLVIGKTDVFNAYLSNEPYVLESKGLQVTIINPRDYGIDFYGDVLFTSETVVAKMRKEVEAFRQASIKGWYYALDHPEEAIDVIKTIYLSPKTKSQMRYEANIIRKIMMPEVVEIGHMNPVRWRKIAEHLVSIELIPTGWTLEGFLYQAPPRIDWDKWRPWIFAGVAVFFALMIFTSLLFQRNMQLKKIHVDLQSEISERKKALAEVKTLSGLIPICSSCQRIRDDKGYWKLVADYMSKHSDALFSHGICPECAKRLYPKSYKEEDHNS